MIHVKDHKQIDMFNSFAHLGPKRLALLVASWAHLFRAAIQHKLPVAKRLPLSIPIPDTIGRRTKELHSMLGLVLLQQMESCGSAALKRCLSYRSPAEVTKMP
jgi:hypothetical protein